MTYYNRKTKMVYIGTLNYLLGLASPSLTMLAAMADPRVSIVWISRRKCASELRRAASEHLTNAIISGIRHGETSNLVNDLGGYKR